jgi:hypothetical protein
MGWWLNRRGAVIYKTAKQRALEAYVRRYPKADIGRLATKPLIRGRVKCIRIIDGKAKRRAVYAYGGRERVGLLHEERV